MELEEDKVGDRNLMGIYKKWSGLIFDDAFQSGGIHSRSHLSRSEGHPSERQSL
ncbi:cell adhesion protein, partial [Paenibacillus sp. 28ISP30-2]|nr:cell adhesion protein [Paenibacillus sp. 28ISP30-2]